MSSPSLEHIIPGQAEVQRPAILTPLVAHRREAGPASGSSSTGSAATSMCIHCTRPRRRAACSHQGLVSRLVSSITNSRPTSRRGSAGPACALSLPKRACPCCSPNYSLSSPGLHAGLQREGAFSWSMPCNAPSATDRCAAVGRQPGLVAGNVLAADVAPVHT